MTRWCKAHFFLILWSACWVSVGAVTTNTTSSSSNNYDGEPPLTNGDAWRIDGRCTQGSQPFHSSLVLTHVFAVDNDHMKDAWKISHADLSLLGNLIVNIYNQEQQGEHYCDPHYRRLTSVSSDASIRYTQEELGSLIQPHDRRSATIAVPIRYDFIGYCDNCHDAILDVVDEPIRRLRHGQKYLPAVTGTSNRWKPLVDSNASSSSQVSDECICQSSATTLHRAPTKEELLQALNQVIAQPQYTSPSRLIAIQSLVELQPYNNHGELEEGLVRSSSVAQRRTQEGKQPFIDVLDYACEPPFQQFDATVFLRVPTSAVADLAADDMTALEDTFLSTYNNLTFSLCDVPRFRKITSATAELVQEGRDYGAQQEALNSIWMSSPESPSSSSTTTSAQETSIIVVQVKTECQRCNATTPLFHPVSNPSTTAPEQQQQQQQSVGTGELAGRPFGTGGFANTRQAPSSSRCVCPEEGHATNVFRAPTAEEFRTQFNAYQNAVLGDTTTTTTEEQLLLQVEEEQRLDCAVDQGPAQLFTSYSRMQLNMSQSNSLDDQAAKALLEQTFQDTYNDLTYLYCDEKYRRVINVTVQPDGNGGNIDLTGASTVVFVVNAQCHGCGEEERLFDESNVVSRYLLGRSLPKGRRLQTNSFCTCAPGVDPGPSPSKEDFVAAFNENIHGMELQTATSAEDLVEAQEVSCGVDPSIKVFNSTVLADLSLDIKGLNETEKLLLQDTFKEVYNEIAFRKCDNHFRTVLDVKLEDEDAFRDRGNRIPDTSIVVDDGIGQNTTSSSTDAVFSITGQCRNCNLAGSGYFALFDDAMGSTGPVNASRRGLAINSGEMTHSRGRNLQATPTSDICFCPTGTQPGNNQGPTADELERALNLQIAELQADGFLPRPVGTTVGTTAGSYATVTPLEGVKVVKNVLETHPVNCSATNVTEFTSGVYTGLRLDKVKLGSSQIEEIEEGFKAIYNNLTFMGCDGFFRTIKEVNLLIGDIVGDMASTRRLQSVGSSNKNGTLLEPTVFVVTGECRNCPVSESGSFNLFDEGFRRLLLQDEGTITSSVRFSRILDDLPEETCFCPAGTMPGRGPSSLEFASLFNDFVLGVAGDAASIQLGDETLPFTVVNLECSTEELEVLDALYQVTIPQPVLNLANNELQAFIDKAYPKAYNELRDDECSPTLIKTSIVDTNANRRFLQSDGMVRPTARVISVQSLSTSNLFRSDNHEEMVAERVLELFLESNLGQSSGVEVVTTSVPTAKPVSATPAPGNPQGGSTPVSNPGGSPQNPGNAPKNPGTSPQNPGTSPQNPGTSPQTPRPTAKPTAKPTAAPSLPPSTSAPNRSTTIAPTTSPPTPVPTFSNSNLTNSTPIPTTIPTAGPTGPTSPPTPFPTWEKGSVTRLALIDCNNGTPVMGHSNLWNGIVLNRATLPASLTIEAITEPPEIGEVRFYLDGELVEIELKAPYALASNTGSGAYKPSDRLEPSDKIRTLRAVPIWWWGLEGKALEVNFTVVRSP